MKINLYKLKSTEIYVDELMSQQAFSGLMYCREEIPRREYVEGIVPNHDYGRSAILGNFEGVGDYRYLSVKGIGWTKTLIPYLAADWGAGKFYLGLLELEPGGNREWKTNEFFKKHDFFCTRVAHVCVLDNICDAYGNIKNTDDLTLDSSNMLNPVNVYVLSRSRYRISDLRFMTPEQKESVIYEGKLFFGVTKTSEFIDILVKIIIKNIAILHNLGGVNGTLGPQNVTCLGELTDFEDILFPGLPFNNPGWNENVEDRQVAEIQFAFDLIYDIHCYFSIQKEYFSIQKFIADEYRQYAQPEKVEMFFSSLFL